MSSKQESKPKRGTLRLLGGRSIKDAPELQPDPADSEPPKGMTPAATDKWRETYAVLAALGVMTPADRDALRLYCETWVSWVRVRDVLDREGETYRSHKGVVARPEARIERAYREALVKIMDRLGMTPVGRRRLRVRPNTLGGNSLTAFAAARRGDGRPKNA